VWAETDPIAASWRASTEHYRTTDKEQAA